MKIVSPTAESDDSSPLPLIVAVTGHRDLRREDVPGLERAARTLLLDVQRRYRHTSLVLLSPLAEGADRLTARVALDLGLRLVVPLPLPKEIYEQDFETAESRAEFEQLIARAQGIVDLPPLVGAEAHVSRPGPERDLAYARLGAYLASHSQVFVAFWDGVSEGENEKVGGTAQVVRFRLEGVPPVYESSPRSALTTASTGPVHHIMTPRQSSAAATAHPCMHRVLLPADATAESFERLCGRMDVFNRDARQIRSEAGAVEKSLTSLLDVPAASVPGFVEAMPATCQRILSHYASADALALHFGVRTLAASRRVFIGVLAAAFFFNMQAYFYSFIPKDLDTPVGRLVAMPWFMVMFLALSAFTALWLYGRAQKGEYQNKYLDYRALAEALRIQFYWRIAGRPEAVVDSYLRKQRSELEWIRDALSSWHVMTIARRSGEPDTVVPAATRERLLSHWIQDQRRYFASKALREEKQLGQERAITAGILQLSAALSIILTLMLSIPVYYAVGPLSVIEAVGQNIWVQTVVLTALSMLGVSAGLMHAYTQQMARSEHIRQFGRMSELFNAAEIELPKLVRDGRQDAADALVKELGIEALEENGDWLILHRERPLEVPNSG